MYDGLHHLTTISGVASDSKYFAATWKGEADELKKGLRSTQADQRVCALKRIIASMSVGLDVGQFFPDVLNCVQTERLEQKKLAYLYLTAQAHTKPEHTMLAVNSLLKDCMDNRPLLRAFAVRTLGYIRVPNLAEYLAEPLQKCLADEDPYVRKTAAISVAKLHKINPELVDNFAFIDILQNLVFDSNATVVSNAIVALSNIDSSKMPEFTMNLVLKLLVAITECNEWGQVYILEAICDHFHPSKPKEAQSLCERVGAYLAHSNTAVVLSALRVLFTFVDLLPEEDQKHIVAKLSPPLGTLLSGQPELQYITLRNVQLILQKRPDLLRQDIRLFFLKYNDPIYVKLEKIDILVRLAMPYNMVMILEELKEYAKEVDIELVRCAIRAIGRCTIKLEITADRCVSALLELVDTKISYIVEEVIVVFRDIFRKYPNKYEGVSKKLFADVDHVDNPEAQAALIWMIGEYSDRIDDAEELIEQFITGFTDECLSVQLSLLTAIVKMFLRNPAATTKLTHSVLEMSVNSNCPDLRDRGFIYWRLLSSDPEAARNIVLAERPPIAPLTDTLQPCLIDQLLRQIGSLATVYHAPPETFQKC